MTDSVATRLVCSAGLGGWNMGNMGKLDNDGFVRPKRVLSCPVFIGIDATPHSPTHPITHLTRGLLTRWLAHAQPTYQRWRSSPLGAQDSVQTAGGPMVEFNLTFNAFSCPASPVISLSSSKHRPPHSTPDDAGHLPSRSRGPRGLAKNPSNSGASWELGKQLQLEDKKNSLLR